MLRVCNETGRLTQKYHGREAAKSERAVRHGSHVGLIRIMPTLTMLANEIEFPSERFYKIFFKGHRVCSSSFKARCLVRPEHDGSLGVLLVGLEARTVHDIVEPTSGCGALPRASTDAGLSELAPLVPHSVARSRPESAPSERSTSRSAPGESVVADSNQFDRKASRSPIEPVRPWRLDFDRSLLAADIFCIAPIQLGWILACSNWIGHLGGPLILALTSIPTILDIVLLYAMGSYRRETLLGQRTHATRMMVAIGLSGVVFFVALNFLSLRHLLFLPTGSTAYPSVEVDATLAFGSSGLALASIALSRALIGALVAHRYFCRRVLVIGNGTRAEHVKQLMSRMPHCLLNDIIIVPESAPGNDIVGRAGNSHSAFKTRSLKSISHELNLDEIVVATEESHGLPIESLLACKAIGVMVSDYNSFVERETKRIDVRRADASWLVYSKGFRIGYLDALLKRALDIALSLALLSIAGPVLLVSMAAIATTQNGPVIFRQQRITKNGRSFWMYKLRTMRRDAEAGGPQWSHTNDSRVTPLGALLRRFRIDEIPQLINVLRGDMSLVGPRPEQPHFVNELVRELPLYDLRHSVKAGITGWAQINYPYGATKGDAERKLEYDLYYIKNYSFFREISILLQTVRVVFWPPKAD
jgi:sugar transferase (PEP-CTERM system associated)